MKQDMQREEDETDDNLVMEYISRLETLNDFFRYLSVVLHLKMPGPHYQVISAQGHDFILFAVRVWNYSHRFMMINHDAVIDGIKEAWKNDLTILRNNHCER